MGPVDAGPLEAMFSLEGELRGDEGDGYFGLLPEFETGGCGEGLSAGVGDRGMSLFHWNKIIMMDVLKHQISHNIPRLL